MFKINWNVALDKSDKKMGVKFMPKDFGGQVLSTIVPFIIDPTVSKVMAAWKVVKLCKDMGFQQIIMEGDG